MRVKPYLLPVFVSVVFLSSKKFHYERIKNDFKKSINVQLIFIIFIPPQKNINYSKNCHLVSLLYLWLNLIFKKFWEFSKFYHRHKLEHDFLFRNGILLMGFYEHVFLLLIYIFLHYAILITINSYEHGFVY